MAKVVSLDDVRVQRVEKIGGSGLPYWRTSFIKPEGDEDPQAYLIENSPGATIASHFHDVDQFQVFVTGEGELGRTPVQPFSVHFARAFTTYGPIESRGSGLGWMTLRPRRDLGAKMIDTHRGSLLEQKNRQPWQRTVGFDYPEAAAEGKQSRQVLDGDAGLSVTALTLAAGQSAPAGDPGVTICQYILVTAGSLVQAGREHGLMTVVHVGPGEDPFQLAAGPAGLQCLVLNFPRSGVLHAEPDVSAAAADPDAAWHCELCGFVYDPAEGLPAQGIRAGTAWANVPEDFKCPDCAATKKDFTALAFD